MAEQSSFSCAADPDRVLAGKRKQQVHSRRSPRAVSGGRKDRAQPVLTKTVVTLRKKKYFYAAG
jgi:hypothetical protein